MVCSRGKRPRLTFVLCACFCVVSHQHGLRDGIDGGRRAEADVRVVRVFLCLCLISTDFGGEYEVTAHTFSGLGKNEIAYAEKRGAAASRNHMMILTIIFCAEKRGAATLDRVMRTK
jgi:hypothetical protein